MSSGAPIPDASTPTVETPEIGGFDSPTPASSTVLLALCGLKIPLPALPGFGKFKFPGFNFPILLPFIFFGVNCSASNPLDFSAGLPTAGGRKPKIAPDPDDRPDD